MKRILIVEDEVIISQVYSKKFSRAGFLVEIAGDGAEGQEKIASFKPDLVLLDVMLPKVNGLDVLKSIRANPATRSLPVIVYSSAFTASVTQEARRLGASLLMSKTDTHPNQVINVACALLQTPAPLPEIAQERDRIRYVESAKAVALEMRQKLSECLNSNDSSMLVDLRHKSRVLGALAWLADVHRVARLAEGLDALLRTLCEHPTYISFSTDKTVLQTVNCLGELMNSVEEAQAPILSPSVLIVDDQEVSLLGAQMALNKARLSSTAVLSSEEALSLLENNSYDLVLLDIDMPVIDGMTLCRQLRSLPRHKDTPVVFFSQLSEIAYRMESSAVGGSDFIGKPFLTVELAVKALMWIVKPRGVSGLVAH